MYKTKTQTETQLLCDSTPGDSLPCPQWQTQSHLDYWLKEIILR